MTRLDDIGWIGDMAVRIDRSGSGPPWPLQVRDPASDTWEDVGAAPPARSYVPLYDSTAGAGGVSEFVYDPIDTGFASLLLMAQLRSTSTEVHPGAYIQFNGDVGSNYEFLSGYWYSGGVGADPIYTAATAGFFGEICNSLSPTSSYGSLEGTVLNYKSAHIIKTLVSMSYCYGPSGLRIGIWQGSQWLNTDPITRLRVFPTSGDFVQYSRLTIVGLVAGG